ncbi:MAG: 50S ribosomal protein L4 [Candidatus Pacearchaeota archaeon]
MKNKVVVLNTQGEKLKEIEYPSFFCKEIREDIVSKVLEAKKTKQLYSPFFLAGKQHSASGKISHRRHVWRSGYGRGISRIPRKILLRRGNQFNWVGAEVSSTRGGRRAHPPKSSLSKDKKINKKEMKIALQSALSATANKKKILSKYISLCEEDVKNIPIIVESKIVNMKTRDFVSSLKKILGERLFEIAIKRKKIRKGKGKMRGRKYRKSAGALIVTSSEEKIKTKLIDSKKVNTLGVQDLAKGGLGRIVIYTENAIKELEKRLKGDTEIKNETKTN